MRGRESNAFIPKQSFHNIFAVRQVVANSAVLMDFNGINGTLAKQKTSIFPYIFPGKRKNKKTKMQP